MKIVLLLSAMFYFSYAFAANPAKSGGEQVVPNAAPIDGQQQVPAPAQQQDNDDPQDDEEEENNANQNNDEKED